MNRDPTESSEYISQRIPVPFLHEVVLLRIDEIDRRALRRRWTVRGSQCQALKLYVSKPQKSFSLQIPHSPTDSRGRKKSRRDVVCAIERECRREHQRARTGHRMPRRSPRQQQSVSRPSTPCGRSTPLPPPQSAKTLCGSTTRTRPRRAAARSRGRRFGWHGAMK